MHDYYTIDPARDEELYTRDRERNSPRCENCDECCHETHTWVEPITRDITELCADCFGKWWAEMASRVTAEPKVYSFYFGKR